MISKRRRSPEKTKHLRGLVRVAGYFTCATLVCGVISIRHARAEYADQSLVFGRQMLDLAKASNHDVTKVIFNGQPVHVGSSVSDDGPDKVLERYEEYCKANRAQTDDFASLGKDYSKPGKNGIAGPITNPLPDLKAATDGDAKKAQQEQLAKVGYVRSAGRDGEGSVVCFAKGPKTKNTTAEAFQSFMTTGELGAFGELRYAYTSKAPSGKTLVLTVWTDSQFNMRQMIGEEGKDAPGEDFAEVPRVPNAFRVMSAKAADAPYGVNVYRTKDSPQKTFEYYDAEMKKLGWFMYDPEMTVEEHKGLGRSYMKNGVVVTLGTSAQDDGNYVALGLSGVAADEKIGRR